MFGRLGIPELLIVFMLVVGSMVIVLWPATRICQRLGLSPWLGILSVFPVANLFLLWYVALTPWPARR